MTERDGCILALDIGTSSVRGVLFDRTGSALAGGPVLQLVYGWRTGADGAMEADAEELFRETARVIDSAVAVAGEEGYEISAVATAAFWHSLVGLASDGTPVTPVYAWGDTRPAAAASRLRRELDEAEVHRRTGCFLDASYPAARLLWLQGRDPDIFRRVSHWMSFAEFIGLRLFGERRCSLSMASGTGLLDDARRRWDAEMLDAVGVDPAQLSALVDVDTPYLGLQAEWAARWPALAAIPWLPALGDGACANLGSGAVGGAFPALTVGTTAAIRVLVDEAAPIPGLWAYRLDGRRRVLGRALSNGGNVVAALERTLNLPRGAERETALKALAPDAHGMTVLPFLIGERGPGAQPGPGAAVVGQRHGTHPVEILRAWLEAVALRIAGAAASLEQSLGAPERIVAGGGALNASAVWRQILADALGRPLALSAVAETAARGAALMALEHLGLVDDAAALPAPLGEETHPVPEHRERYRDALRRQKALEAALGAVAVARAVQPPSIP